MNSRFWTKRAIGCAALIGAALSTTPAHANDGFWLLLGDGGKLGSGLKPDRVMHYANGARIRDRTDQGVKMAEIMRDANPKTIDARIKALEIQEMDIVEIHENPRAPGIKNVTMQFHCGKKAHRVVRAEAIERNYLRRFSGATEWQTYVPTDWQSRAFFVACFPEVWVPMAKADQAEIKRTGKVTKQSALREYGVAQVGTWSNNDGLTQAYKFTWDKLWAGDATPAPFHHNRTAAEEKEYQEWRRKNDAVIGENEKAAPAVQSAIAGLEAQVKGEQKGVEEERAFQNEINKNFSKQGSKYYAVFKGFTEEQLVNARGAPKNALNDGNLRVLVYHYATDNSSTVITSTDGKGAVTGTAVAPHTLNCVVTFKLRVGGNHPQQRVVDYSVEVDMVNQGAFRAADCR